MAEDWNDDVDDLLVSVVWAVTVVGKGKVFGDLWDVWFRSISRKRRTRSVCTAMRRWSAMRMCSGS